MHTTTATTLSLPSHRMVQQTSDFIYDHPQDEDTGAPIASWTRQAHAHQRDVSCEQEEL